MVKMDGIAPRTAMDLQRQYGKTFAEAMGLAESAENKAEEAIQAANMVDQNLTRKEIFKRLFEDGKVLGVIYLNDQLYFNATYINSGEINADLITAGTLDASKLKVKNLKAENLYAGKFETTGVCYVPPEMEDVAAVYQYVNGTVEKIPEGAVYDMDGDGDVDIRDVACMMEAMNGYRDMSELAGAVLVNVTITVNPASPDKTICIKGTNQWGREFERSVGVRQEKGPVQMSDAGTLFARSYDETYYIGSPLAVGTEYCTADQWMGKHVYEKLISIGKMPNSTTGTYSVTLPSGVSPVGADVAPFARVDGFVKNSATSWTLTITTVSDMSSEDGYLHVRYTK